MANKRIKDLSTTKYKGFLPLDDEDGTGKFPIESLMGAIAPLFDSTRTSGNPYNENELVMYRGTLYKFTSSHYGAWSDSDAIPLPVNYLLADKDICSIHLRKSNIQTYSTGPCFSNMLVRSGTQYRVRIRCNTISVSDDPRIGIYLYLGYTNVDSIHLTPAELMAGVDFLYTPSSDGDIRLRTLEEGVIYSISVSRVMGSEELRQISHVGGGKVEKIVTTDVTTLSKTGIRLKKDVKYVCSVDADDNWASTSTDSRIGVWILNDDETYSQPLSCSAGEMKAGASVSITPTQDCELCVRTLEIGVSVVVTVISDEEPVGETLESLRNDIALISSDWLNKKWAAYGDSITAISNGDALSNGWAKYVNEKLKFSEFHGRGIGGTSFKYQTGGGTVAFINSTTGNYDSRDSDGHTKDDYTGSVPADCVATRSSFCSWDRIIHMFPASIKDNIDLIFVMGGTNDTHDGTEAQFIQNDTTDPEWALSSYYSTYGGDFNITTLKGGVASTIMKLNAWMPQALIVLGTPLSGRKGSPVGDISTDTDIAEYTKGKDISDISARCSCPCVEVFNTDGIMPFNRTLYITDGVHPYNTAGQKMLARAVIAGLKNVMPHI